MEVWQEYRVNMGNWEHVIIGGRLVFDIGEDNASMDAAVEAAHQRLEEGLFEQLQQARSLTAEDESFVFEYHRRKRNESQDVTPPPSRRR
jgi:hypothetical protein